MSKIYEALLRAELERAVASGRPETASSVAIEDVLLSVEEPTFPPDEHLPEAGGLLLAQEPASPPAEAAPASSLDFTEVTPRSWSPVLASLPALAERGAGVEQFRSLRSHLVEFREQGPMKTVLVSSGHPGEGKSFVALNLALSFARHKNNQVLLIDGDMRRSSLHKALGAPQEPGFAEYLSGEATAKAVMQRQRLEEGVIPIPGLATLTFIAGGKYADKAGDLSASSRFAELIAAASTHFDWIIVDSPPVNLVADAVSLARHCDGVLLVGREGVTKYKTAQQAQAQFKAANVLGYVLNAMRKLPTKSDYYAAYDGYKAEA